jgi:hypothetical protein
MVYIRSRVPSGLTYFKGTGLLARLSGPPDLRRRYSERYCAICCTQSQISVNLANL